MTQVLIIEDVDTMRALLAHLIGEIPGLKVTAQARNAAEARLELTRRRPDLVLLDEVLPGESSLDLLKDLQGLPVWLVSGTPEGRTLPKGAQGRLAKPSWDTLPADIQRYAQALSTPMRS